MPPVAEPTEFRKKCKKAKCYVVGLASTWARAQLLSKPVIGRLHTLGWLLNATELQDQAARLEVVDKPVYDMRHHEVTILELDSHQVTIRIEVFVDRLDSQPYFWIENDKARAHNEALEAVNRNKGRARSAEPIRRQRPTLEFTGQFTGVQILQRLLEVVDWQIEHTYHWYYYNCQVLAVRLRDELLKPLPSSRAPSPVRPPPPPTTTNSAKPPTTTEATAAGDMDKGKWMECPLSHATMVEPMIAGDGYTYEKDPIQAYIKKTSGFFSTVPSPQSGRMDKNLLYPNRLLQQLLPPVISDQKSFDTSLSQSSGRVSPMRPGNGLGLDQGAPTQPQLPKPPLPAKQPGGLKPPPDNPTTNEGGKEPKSLITLPGKALDAIASYLRQQNLHHLIAAGRRVMDVYGGRGMRVKIPDMDSYNELEHVHRRISSLLRHRPCLHELAITGNRAAVFVAQAMKEDRCRELQVLNIRTGLSPNASLKPLFASLQAGACPKLSDISLDLGHIGNVDMVIRSLSEALGARKRMDKVCVTPRSLEIASLHSIELYQLIACSAFNTLEELRLKDCSLSEQAAKDLARWMTQTKAGQLKALSIKLYPLTRCLAVALSTPHVGLKLQNLELDIIDCKCLHYLTCAFQRVPGPELRQLTVRLNEECWMYIDTGALILAIANAGASLRKLCIGGESINNQDGKVIITCLRHVALLEELDLSGSKIDDRVINDLLKELEANVPCRSTLRRVTLTNCKLVTDGCITAAKAKASTMCPRLTFIMGTEGAALS